MYRCYHCGTPVEQFNTSCGCIDTTKQTAYSVFKPTSNKLVFEFEKPEDAEGFKEWLCNQGEQDFWSQDDIDEYGYGYEFFFHILGGNTVKCFRYKKE